MFVIHFFLKKLLPGDWASWLFCLLGRDATTGVRGLMDWWMDWIRILWVVNMIYMIFHQWNMLLFVMLVRCLTAHAHVFHPTLWHINCPTYLRIWFAHSISLQLWCFTRCQNIISLYSVRLQAMCASWTRMAIRRWVLSFVQGHHSHSRSIR